MLWGALKPMNGGAPLMREREKSYSALISISSSSAFFTRDQGKLRDFATVLATRK
jgi:hypothetical protein